MVPARYLFSGVVKSNPNSLHSDGQQMTLITDRHADNVDGFPSDKLSMLKVLAHRPPSQGIVMSSSCCRRGAQTY